VESKAASAAKEIVPPAVDPFYLVIGPGQVDHPAIAFDLVEPIIASVA
jgi:hypothetical protein